MHPCNPVGSVRSSLHSGALVQALAEAATPHDTRALTAEDITALEAGGNAAADWTAVRVSAAFRPEKVRNCYFAGPAVLGSFKGDVEVDDGLRQGAGLYGSTFNDVVIHDDALIANTSLMGRMAVGHGAVVVNCGQVSSSPGATFGLPLTLKLGPETGQRAVAVHAEITRSDLVCLAMKRADTERLEEYDRALSNFMQSIHAPRGIIGPGARVMHTPVIRRSLIGAHARVSGASVLEDCVLLSSADQPVSVSSGAVVRRAVLQWGASVEDHGIVSDSMLAESAHVGRQGKVSHSYIGAQSGVESGEVTSSLVGPLVGFHHQALLIGALWPEGKGNVGYGANIGSNHTGRAPDQELRGGEGVFFGLSSSVTFPADFSRAPYTIIATGVTMLSQRLEMPFSLVRRPSTAVPGVSPAFNEIIPGWVLSDCFYALRRNEGKYAARFAARTDRIDTRILRPELVDLMHEARAYLRQTHQREIHTEREIRGLGKNFLTEPNRTCAIETYTRFIRLYALLAYWENRQRMAGKPRTEWPNDPVWHHAAPMLGQEFEDRDPPKLLMHLREAVEDVARSVEQSKARDDRRGARTIADYAQIHPPAAQDAVVRETWAWARALQKDIDEALASNA